MGSDKIFMFDNPAAGESAGIMSMIPALLQNKGLDPNLVAALMNGNKNQDAWGGAGCYWIWIILLFFLWGGNGFGNGFGNGANGIPAQLNNEAGRELLMNAIQGNGTAINQLASSLNCSTQQLQNAICQIQGQIQQVGNQVGLSLNRSSTQFSPIVQLSVLSLLLAAAISVQLLNVRDVIAVWLL